MNAARYRVAEARFWAWTGAHPTELWVQLAHSHVRVRVQAVGDGPTVLFVAGAPYSGSIWAPLVRQLSGFRCLLVDRPGTGLSEPFPVALSVETLPVFADTFIGDVLDALEIARASLVAHSFGGYLGLRAAAAQRERIDRIVLVGCPAFVPHMSIPLFMRFMTVGLMRRMLNALPPNERAEKMILRQIGEGASLDAGLIPRAFLDWSRAHQRDTDTMRNDGDLIGSLGSPRGFDPVITLTESLLRSVAAPTLFLWGEDDGFGGAAVARDVAGLVPSGRLELLPRSGHLPWIENAVEVARLTAAFFRQAAA